jgi:hypothetical protein
MRFSSEARLISSSTAAHSFCRRTTSSSIDLMYIFWRSRWFLCSDLDFDMLLMDERQKGRGAVPLCSPHLLSSAVIHGVCAGFANPWAWNARLFFGNQLERQASRSHYWMNISELLSPWQTSEPVEDWGLSYPPRVLRKAGDKHKADGLSQALNRPTTQSSHLPCLP